MYVSGPPGTGKSTLVSEVCGDIQGMEGVKTAYINCMTAKYSRDIYRNIIEELDPDGYVANDHQMAHLRAIFLPKNKTSNLVCVVTLDEIDHLLTLDLEILYTLFGWALHRSSRLIVIGIANALDLTDRFLPRLKARNLKPQLLPFLPYTATQIASVITSKLKSFSSFDHDLSSDYTPFLHPAAIQLCSKKVASQTGDLRKAFDIVCRTIDAIEAETKQNFQSNSVLQNFQRSPSKIPLSENTNLSRPTPTTITVPASLASLTPMTAPRATIAHVSRVSAAALSNGTSQRLQTLNLHQKAAICALISHQKTYRNIASPLSATPSRPAPAPTIRQLYATYSALCARENALHPLTNTEFTDIIGGLETLGFLGEENGRGGKTGTPSRKRKVSREEKRVLSFIDEREVKGCLEGLGGGILKNLLDFHD